MNAKNILQWSGAVILSIVLVNFVWIMFKAEFISHQPERWLFGAVYDPGVPSTRHKIADALTGDREIAGAGKAGPASEGSSGNPDGSSMVTVDSAWEVPAGAKVTTKFLGTKRAGGREAIRFWVLPGDAKSAVAVVKVGGEWVPAKTKSGNPDQLQKKLAGDFPEVKTWRIIGSVQVKLPFGTRTHSDVVGAPVAEVPQELLLYSLNEAEAGPPPSSAEPPDLDTPVESDPSAT